RCPFKSTSVRSLSRLRSAVTCSADAFTAKTSFELLTSEIVCGIRIRHSPTSVAPTACICVWPIVVAVTGVKKPARAFREPVTTSSSSWAGSVCGLPGCWAYTPLDTSAVKPVSAYRRDRARSARRTARPTDSCARSLLLPAWPQVPERWTPCPVNGNCGTRLVARASVRLPALQNPCHALLRVSHARRKERGGRDDFR